MKRVALLLAGLALAGGVACQPHSIPTDASFANTEQAAQEYQDYQVQEEMQQQYLDSVIDRAEALSDRMEDHE